ncbi:hypothetical protein JCM19039_1851 [Geomicrobium sp. JCM 19039]|nr:hypothetical protein JCM19039_1851 [Geomicrobium sp. JCM 19039]
MKIFPIFFTFASFIVSFIVLLLVFLTKNPTVLIISGILLLLFGVATFFSFILFSEPENSFGLGIAGVVVLCVTSVVSVIVIVVGAIKKIK